MNAWSVVWHLAKWELVRARWLVLGINASLLLQVGFAAADVWNRSLSLLGYMSFCAAVLLTGLSATADLPVSATAYNRGRPISWWMVPTAKFVAVLTAVCLPSLLLSVGVLLPYAEPPLARLEHLLSVLAMTVLMATIGVTAGALSLPGRRGGALWLTCYLVGFAVDAWLKSTKWQGMPSLLWVAGAAALALALFSYRRRCSQGVSAIGLLAISQLFVVATTKAQLNSSDLPASVVRDSLGISIDSVAIERPHLARIAFTVETNSPIDAVHLPRGFVSPGVVSWFAGLERAGHRSDIVLEVSSDRGRTLTFSDPRNCHAVSLTNGSERGGHGEAGQDLLLDSPDTRGIRRAHAVALVALWDSVLPTGRPISLSGTAYGLHARREAVLPLRVNAASREGTVHWHVQRDSSPAGVGVSLARESLRSPWTGDTAVRGWDSDRHVARFVGANSTANGAANVVPYTSSSASTSIMVLPGFERFQRTYRVCSALASSAATDSVELLHLSPVGQFGFHATATLAVADGARP